MPRRIEYKICDLIKDDNLLEIVEILENNNVTLEERAYAAHYAGSTGKFDSLKILIEHEPSLDVNNTYYNLETFLFASVNHINIVEYLLNAGANVHINKEARSLFSVPYSGTALHHACEGADKNIEVVKKLLAAGANINERMNGASGATPLLVTVTNNDCSKLVQCLLEQGADANIKLAFPFWGNALDCAIQRKNIKLIKMLIKVTDLNRWYLQLIHDNQMDTTILTIIDEEIVLRKLQKKLNSLLFSTRETIISFFEDVIDVSDDNSLETNYNAFSSLDAIALKLLQLITNYNPGNNEHRKERRDALIKYIENIYQQFSYNISELYVENIELIKQELFQICEKFTLEIEINHAENSWLQPFGKQSTFASSMRHFLLGNHGYNSKPTMINLEDDLTRFNFLIGKLKLPSQWSIQFKNHIQLQVKPLHSDIEFTEVSNTPKNEVIRILAFQVANLQTKLKNDLNFKEAIVELKKYVEQAINDLPNTGFTLFESSPIHALNKFLIIEIDPLLTYQQIHYNENLPLLPMSTYYINDDNNSL